MSRNCKGYSPTGGCYAGDITSDYASYMTSGSSTDSTAISDTANYGNQLANSTQNCNVTPCDNTKDGLYAQISDPTGNKKGNGINQYKDCASFRDSLVTPVTYKVKKSDGSTLTINDKFNKNFKYKLDEAIKWINEDGRYKIDITSIYRDSTVDDGRLSLHSYGIAIDFNKPHNPYGYGNATYCPECKKNVGDDDIHIRTENHYLVKKLTSMGWNWGGKFRKPDYMHFCLING